MMLWLSGTQQRKTPVFLPLSFVISMLSKVEPARCYQELGWTEETVNNITQQWKTGKGTQFLLLPTMKQRNRQIQIFPRATPACNLGKLISNVFKLCIQDRTRHSCGNQFIFELQRYMGYMGRYKYWCCWGSSHHRPPRTSTRIFWLGSDRAASSCIK